MSKIGSNTIDKIYAGATEIEKIYQGSTAIYEKPSTGYTGLCFTANTAGSTVELTKVGNPPINNTAYSRDGVTWITFTPSTSTGTNTITLTNVGDKVYFKNDIIANFSYGNYLKFVMSGSIAASGNCNSIYDATNYETLTTLTYYECYKNMFVNCTSLTTAPQLPATTLASYCYYYMFSGCTSLTTAPQLPATTLASDCYYGMFYDCTSLYVSDRSTSSASYEWRIPTSGTFTISLTMEMFLNCLGSRSSNSLVAVSGSYVTYYTQNTPV